MTLGGVVDKLGEKALNYVNQSELNHKLANAADWDERGDKAALIKQIENLISEVRGAPYNTTRENLDKSSLQSFAGKLYSARRAIDSKFGMDGFASSPAWDIMLDLIDNEQKGKVVSITSACIGAACPNTTALRWLQVLVGMSLIERHDDQNDKRRSYIRLTKKGRDTTIEALRAHM